MTSYRLYYHNSYCFGVFGYIKSCRIPIIKSIGYNDQAEVQEHSDEHNSSKDRSVSEGARLGRRCSGMVSGSGSRAKVLLLAVGWGFRVGVVVRAGVAVAVSEVVAVMVVEDEEEAEEE